MTKLTRRLVLNAIILSVIVTNAGFSGCNQTPTTNPVPLPFQVTGEHQYRELGVAVVTPTPGDCKEGRIVISGGSDPQSLLIRNLNGPVNGPFDAPFPALPSQGQLIAWDNQIARLANGDLILLWQGSTTAPLSDAALAAQGGVGNLPPWWKKWNVNTKWDDPNDGSPALVDNPKVTTFFNNNPGNRNGLRSAHFLWRFSAVGCAWSGPFALDAGEVSGTRSDGSTLGYCAQLAPGLAGFDRPELYVDPWGYNPSVSVSKQRIYVSTLCGRCLEPPCAALVDQGLDDDSVQVFMSPDSGASWQTGMRLNAPQPAAMTSTPPNGRLFMFNTSGDPNPGVNIYWADPSGNSMGSLKGPFDITYMPVNTDTNENLIDPATNLPVRVLPNWLPGSTLGVASSLSATLSLARTGNNAVLAVYPALEKIPGSATAMRQVAAVVWVVTKGTNDPPIVVPMKIVRAQASTGSVFFATFIEDDRPDAKISTSMLYWLETTSQPAAGADVTMVARYMLFSNGVFPGPETLLSDSAGWKATNNNALADVGDYMKGGFYFHNGALNFVAVWPQVSQVGTPPKPDNSKIQPYVRIISITEAAPSGPPPPPEGMPGVRQATLVRLKPDAKPRLLRKPDTLR